jgi:hypothetical protein
MVLPLVSYELERIWKELSLAYSRYHVGIQGYTGITLCLWMSGFCGSKALQWPNLEVKQSSKCWQPLTQHSVIFQKTWILSMTTIRTSYFSRCLYAGIQKAVHDSSVALHWLFCMIQTTKACRQDNQCPSWTFNCVSAKHNPKTLSQHQPTALLCTVHG